MVHLSTFETCCSLPPSLEVSKMFFFQAEDGIRDRSPSRGLGDVYKRQRLSGASNMSQKLTNGPKVLLKNFGPNWTKNEFALLKKLKKTVFETSRLGGSEPVSYTHLTLPTICSV